MLHYAAIHLGLNFLPKFSKTCLKLPLKKGRNLVFKTDYGLMQDRLWLNAGHKYCKMQGEHSAILSTFIKLRATFVLFIFEWWFYTGFTVPIRSHWYIKSLQKLDDTKR